MYSNYLIMKKMKKDYAEEVFIDMCDKALVKGQITLAEYDKLVKGMIKND